jgi:hypothetical protein
MLSLNELIRDAESILDVPDVDVELSNFPTISGKIRYLASRGMSTSEIGRKLNIRYQHVRNVLKKSLKDSR